MSDIVVSSDGVRQFRRRSVEVPNELIADDRLTDADLGLWVKMAYAIDAKIAPDADEDSRARLLAAGWIERTERGYLVHYTLETADPEPEPDWS